MSDGRGGGGREIKGWRTEGYVEDRRRKRSFRRESEGESKSLDYGYVEILARRGWVWRLCILGSDGWYGIYVLFRGIAGLLECPAMCNTS